jgi:hypothetical protein
LKEQSRSNTRLKFESLSSTAMCTSSTRGPWEDALCCNITQVIRRLRPDCIQLQTLSSQGIHPYFCNTTALLQLLMYRGPYVCCCLAELHLNASKVCQGSVEVTGLLQVQPHQLAAVALRQLLVVLLCCQQLILQL